MKNNKIFRVITSILAVVLILTASITPALAWDYDPFLGMEYDYSEKGSIDLFVGTLDNNEAYFYGGSDYYPQNYCHYYRINDKTAYCCWSNMDAPKEQTSNITKYFVGNHTARAKAMYYFNWANSSTPTGRNEKIASGLPTTFLGESITYYKDYVQAITDYARENRLSGEFNYYNHNDDIMGYLIGHFTMDDMMNAGNGIHVTGQSLDPNSPIVKGVQKLVDEILYNTTVMGKVPNVPDSARVFYCFPDRENQANMGSQGLMSIEAAPTGGFMVDKRSTNGKMTDKSACYSFKGAEFEVYKNSDGTGKIDTLVTDQGGYAKIEGLKPGTYYFKETVAPKGYELNPNMFTVVVHSGDKPEDNNVPVYDEPYNDPAAITIFKNDPDHIEKDDNGNDVKKGIPGVTFELSYYDVDPDTASSLADLGDKVPKRTWAIKTDSRGISRLDIAWKVSGDDFYYQKNSSGQLFGAPVIPLGCLTLKEIETAPGYVIDNTVRFAKVTQSMAENNELVKFSGTDLVNDSVDYPNRQTTTVVSKKSVTTQEELPGAHLKVTDKNGAVIDEWVSTTESHTIKGLTVGETYTLTETIAPDGYATSSSVDFTVLDGGKTTEVTMYDDVTKYKFIKVDGNGVPLKGAVLRLEEISNSKDKFVEEWTTDGTEHIINGKLVVGKSYMLSEVKAPEGYPIALPIRFNVSDDNYTHVLKMENVITKTNVSKKSITTQEELPGAELVVKDKDGNIVDEWTSTDEEHLIEGLKPGETYTLTETISPDGYVVSSDIEFTVNDDGTVTNVEMYDDTTKFKFNKVDEDGNPVEGAVLRLEVFKGVYAVDSATPDEIVEKEVWEPIEGEEWTTDKDGTPDDVNGKLAVGKRDRLVEVKAPKGKNLAKPVEFTVENTAEPVEVTMVNTTTKVNKTNITGDKEVPGAKLIVRDKDGNIVDEWISGDEKHDVENLIEGETYTLEESIPAPGYVTAAPITFTVNADGTTTFVEMKDAPTKIVVRKMDNNNKPVSGAKLQILDKDKKVIEEWTTDGKDHLIEAKLVVGETYTLHEVSAPEGYEVAKDIEFTVKDTADEQVITMTDVYNGGSKISTPDQPTKSTTNQGGGATVRTGQGTTGLMIALAVLMISAACVVFFRKKRESESGC